MKLPDIEFTVERDDLSLALVGLENLKSSKTLTSGFDLCYQIELTKSKNIFKRAARYDGVFPLAEGEDGLSIEGLKESLSIIEKE